MHTKIKNIIPFLLCGAYLSLTCPTIFWGDSGLLVASAYVLGIPQPTGHPLFSTLGKFITLLPLGNIAFKLNLLGIIFTLLSFYLILAVMEKLQRIISLKENLEVSPFEKSIPIIISTAFSVSNMVLFQVQAVETYSLNLFISLLLIFTAVKCEESFCLQDYRGSKNIFFLASFLFGIGFGNHSLLILTVWLPLMFYFVSRFYLAKINASFILSVLLFAILGLSIYIYLPLRAHTIPIANGGDPQTLGRFYWVISGEVYRGGIFSLREFTRNLNFSGLFFAIKGSFGPLIRDLNYYLIIFFIIGQILIYRKFRLLSIALFSIIIFQIILTFPPTLILKKPLEEGGVVGYYLVPLALFSIIGTIGVIGFFRFINRLATRNNLKVFNFALLALLILSTFFSYFSNRSENDSSQDYSAQIFGKEILDSIGYGGILFTVTDAGSFIPPYFNCCEKLRPDTTLFYTGNLFNEMSLNFIKEHERDLLLDYPIQNKKVFTNSDFQDLIKNLGSSRKIYMEAGKNINYDDALTYPNLLTLGFGKSDNEKVLNHWQESVRLVNFLKNQGFGDKKDSLHLFALEIYNIGNHYFKNQNYEFAIKQYKLALDLEPFMQEAASNLLAAYTQSHNYVLGAGLGSKLVELFDNPTIYYNYAISLAGLGMKEKGDEIINKGLIKFQNNKLLQNFSLKFQTLK